jgi:hypothetical protein
MVCFVQHTFRFDGIARTNWSNALCKYYPGIKVTVTVDGKDYRGKIGRHFFNELPEGNEYEVTTDKFNAEFAAIRTLPKYHKVGYNGKPNSKILEIAEAIDMVMQDRLSMGNRQIFIFSELKCDSFDQINEAVKYLQTGEITRVYNCESSCIFFVLDDKHTICITEDEVCDGTLPVFDLDDGFYDTDGSEGILAAELNSNYFDSWHEKFIKMDGCNWDEQIIPSNF